MKPRDLIYNADGTVVIQLPRGMRAIVDGQDAELVAGHNWSVSSNAGRLCAVQRWDRERGGVITLHRLIMGFPDGLTVDHRDSDPLNNRRSNLRVATSIQNAQNRRTTRTLRRGEHKGVSLARSGKWVARIGCNYRREHLGLFDTPEAAAAAYDQAATRLHGAFAALNLELRLR